MAGACCVRMVYRRQHQNRRSKWRKEDIESYDESCGPLLPFGPILWIHWVFRSVECDKIFVNGSEFGDIVLHISLLLMTPTFSSNSERTSVNRDLTDFKVCVVSCLVKRLPRLVAVLRRENGARVEDSVSDSIGKRAKGSSVSVNSDVLLDGIPSL